MSPDERLKIAVLIPVYNRPSSIVDALDSIAQQTVLPQMVVVVDDGSKDDTADRVEEYFKRDDLPFEGRLVRQKNQGPSAARNRAAEEASSCDLIAMIDSDDLWPDDYLERAEQILRESPDAIGVNCDTLRVSGDPSTSVTEEIDSASWIDTDTTIRFATEGYNLPNPSTTVVRRWAYEKVGGYDVENMYWEDYQLLMRLSLLGPWKYSPGKPVTFRVNGHFHENEAPHMGRLHPDRPWYRAKVYEQFIHGDGAKEVVPESIWRPRLAKLWYRAGRKFIILEDRAKAHDCFNRALSWQPGHIKARFWAMRTWPSRNAAST